MSQGKDLCIAAKLADLDPAAMRSIQSLEKELGPNIHLLAVEGIEFEFVLEVKLASNHWERIDRVYLEMRSIQAVHPSEEAAKAAKAEMKDLFRSNRFPQIKKRPIRIHRVIKTDPSG